MENKNNETILIVDDIPEDVDILRELLSNYKHKVALNGTKALQIVNETPPDIILLDIIMPGISGHEVCEKLKTDKKTKDIPIIFITAMDELTDKTKGFELGAVDYITKPFQPEEVLSRIQTHLELNNYRKRLQNINKELQGMVDERTAELLEEKDKWAEAYRAKSDFLMLMSHELRTPMVGILGFSNILKNEIEDEEQKEIAVTLHTAAERLKETLNSILALSQMESTTLKVRIFQFDIIAKINKLMPSHSIKADYKNLKINFEQKDQECNVKIDPVMFEVIFNNILGNAVKYTEKGSIDIKVFSNEEYDCLQVADTGIGVPEDKHSMIFDEFRQVEEGVCRNFQGVGLGLSLVKKYVQMLDGKIEFQSKVNEGTTITIMFPKLKSLTTVNVEMEKELGKFAFTDLKEKCEILLVEDDPINIHIAKLYLEDYANITYAKSGKIGLDLILQKKYDLVLMDINLGKAMNGIETAKAMRKLEEYKDLPIIAFTAFALEGEREIFIREGFTEYIAKPFSKNDLITVIERALNCKEIRN